MPFPPATSAPRIAADAMCGGLARWLRVLGVDTSYRADIDDAALVRLALAEGRLVISSDRKLFERRVFVRGELAGLLLPTGLKRDDQVRFVARSLHIRPGFPRCALCNGELHAVRRDEVGDVVPARSLIWADRFYRCAACRHVFWEGTHWNRIHRLVDELAGTSPDPARPPRE